MLELPASKEVIAALAAIAGGATADSVESETLEFKQPIERSRDDTAKMLAAASMCFANATGGRTVLGVRDKQAGPSAFVGTDLDPGWLRHRIYELSRRIFS